MFILDDMKDLNKESKQTLAAALDRYYVIPKIKRILSIRKNITYSLGPWLPIKEQPPSM